MASKFSISPRTVHTIEITSEELAEKLREIALETDGAVGKNDIIIFVPELERYPDLEIKALYSEAKSIATWLWFVLLID